MKLSMDSASVSYAGAAPIEPVVEYETQGPTVKIGTAPLFDVIVAAGRLGCSESLVRRLVQERRIPYVKLGGTKVRFVEADLNQWIANQRVNAMR